jgi:hypothetical protein
MNYEGQEAYFKMVDIGCNNFPSKKEIHMKRLMKCVIDISLWDRRHHKLSMCLEE